MRVLLLLLGLWIAGAVPAQGQERRNPSFNLANRSDRAINELYATPTGNDRWGRDRLTRYSLSPGQTFPVRLPADGNCSYDIRVIYADGRSEERRSVDTCRLDSVVFPGGRTVAPAGRSESRDPSFRLVNRSRAEVNAVYVSLPGDENWGEDRLGDDTIRAGGRFVVRLPAGSCQYDVRVVFADGKATERRGVDLCAITELPVQ